jgi:hypothetical protein
MTIIWSLSLLSVDGKIFIELDAKAYIIGGQNSLYLYLRVD